MGEGGGSCFELGCRIPLLQGGEAAAAPASHATVGLGHRKGPPQGQTLPKVLRVQTPAPRARGSHASRDVPISHPDLPARSPASTSPHPHSPPAQEATTNRCGTCLVGQDLVESRFWHAPCTVRGPRAGRAALVLAAAARPSRSGPLSWASLSSPLSSVSQLPLCPPLPACGCVGRVRWSICTEIFFIHFGGPLYFTRVGTTFSPIPRRGRAGADLSAPLPSPGSRRHLVTIHRLVQWAFFVRRAH